MTVFDDAVQKRESQKAREARKKTNTGTFEFVKTEKLGLRVGDEPRTEKVFRIVGLPFENRKNAFDSKLVFFSRIIKDGQAGYTHIIWKTILNEDGIPELDESWILYRLYKKITEAKWYNYSDAEKAALGDGKNGKYIPLHSGTKCFARVQANTKEGAKYPPKFYPIKRVLMNVIDRMDDWCVQNKHTKLLYDAINPFTRVNADGKEEVVEFVNNVGISKTAYDCIWENVIKYHHHWDIDVIARTTGDGQNPVIVKDATEKKLEALSLQLAKVDPITAEEEAYERYDVDKLTPHASYDKLYRNIVGLFKMTDAELGESFSKELGELVDKEKSEKAANQETETTQDETEHQEIPESANKESKEAPVAERPQREVKKESSEIDYTKVFPYWAKLSTDDQADIKKALQEVKGNVPIWKAGTNLLPCDTATCVYAGTTERTFLPNTVYICPECGTDFNAK